MSYWNTFKNPYSNFLFEADEDLEDTTNFDSKEEPEEEDKGLAGAQDEQPEEEDVFKVVPEKEVDEDQNYNTFVGRSDDGNSNAIGLNSDNDPAMMGLANVVAGAVLSDKVVFEKIIKSLFDATGLKSLNSDAMTKLKPTIWKELEGYSDIKPSEAYALFSKIVSSSVLNANKAMMNNKVN